MTQRKLSEKPIAIKIIGIAALLLAVALIAIDQVHLYLYDQSKLSYSSVTLLGFISLLALTVADNLSYQERQQKSD